MEKNKKSIGAFIGEYGAFIALALLVIVISCISPEFRTASNFLNLLRQASFNGLIAFGMTCVILSTGIKFCKCNRHCPSLFKDYASDQQLLYYGRSCECDINCRGI